MLDNVHSLVCSDAQVWKYYHFGVVELFVFERRVCDLGMSLLDFFF